MKKYKLFRGLLILSLLISTNTLYGQRRKKKEQEAAEQQARREAAMKDLNMNSEDVFGELDGYLTLRFFDAVEGTSIENATINIEGIGTFSSDETGKVTFPQNENGFPRKDGVYPATFQKDGYIKTPFNVEIKLGSLFHNRYSISPELNAKFIRVVLDWDKSPKDLDAHFIKENGYHISYRKMRISEDGMAELDRDARNGFGPETITIKEIQKSNKYYYLIHDYSNQGKDNSTRLSSSKGSIKIYADGKLYDTITIPNTGTGTIWNVFNIENGKINIINKIAE